MLAEALIVKAGYYNQANFWTDRCPTSPFPENIDVRQGAGTLIESFRTVAATIAEASDTDLAFERTTITKAGATPNVTAAEVMSTTALNSGLFNAANQPSAAFATQPLGNIPVYGLMVTMDITQDAPFTGGTLTVAGRSRNGASISFPVTFGSAVFPNNAQRVTARGIILPYTFSNSTPRYCPFGVNTDWITNPGVPTPQGISLTWDSTFTGVQFRYDFFTAGNFEVNALRAAWREWQRGVEANAWTGFVAAGSLNNVVAKNQLRTRTPEIRAAIGEMAAGQNNLALNGQAGI